MRSVALLLVLLSCGCDADGLDMASKATVAPGQPNALLLQPGSAAAAASAQAPDDHGDGPLDATLLPVGQSVSGQLSTPTDRDWFAVDLAAGQTWRVGFGCYGAARVVVVAPGGTSDVVAANPGSSELSPPAPAAAGRHYLRVETESGRGLFYDLEVR